MMYGDTFPMPFGRLTDTDVSLVDTVERWAQQEVAARRLEHEEDYDKLLFPAMKTLFVDLGLQGLLFPEEAGGSALSGTELAITAAAVLEQVGRVDTGIGFLWANTLSIQAAFGIGENRNEAVLEKMSGAFCGEDLSLVSLVLPGLGDVADENMPRLNELAYQVQAKKTDGGFVLSGKDMRPQCAGADASWFGVIAQVEPGVPALFLVDAASKGVNRGDIFLKTGLAASRNADISMNDVFVPDELCVFTGHDRYQGLLSFYYLCLSSLCQGAMLAGYDIVKEWCETRVIKGKGQIFRDNPLVASLTGDVGAKVLTGRLLVYELAQMIAKPEDFDGPGRQAVHASAVAVLQATSEGAMEVLNRSMELMASAGYATEWNLERYWRDVKTLKTYAGPSTALQMDISRHCFGYQGS